MKPLSTRRIILAALAGLLLLMVALFIVLVSTPAGTRIVWRWSQPFLPPSVKAEPPEGRLIGPLVCKGIEVKTDTFLLRIDRIELQWSPTALLRRRLDIQKIAAESVHLSLLPANASRPEDKTEPVKLPDKIALPLDVNIDALQLQGFEFRSGPTAAPLRIETLSSKLTVDRKKAVLSDLFAQAPRFTVKADAEMSMKKDFRVHGDLRWHFTAPPYPELRGHTRLDGTLANLTIRQTLDKPYGLDAVLTLKNPIDKLQFHAELDAQPDRLNTLRQDLPAAAVRLKATARGDLQEMGLDLAATVKEADLGKADIQLEASFRSNTLFIDGLSATLADQPTRLTATGQVALAGDQRFHIETDWHRLQWPLQNPRITSPEGRLRIEGRLDDYTVEGAAEARGPEKTRATFEISGRGTKKELNLTKIDMKSLDGGLWGSAAIGWSPELHGSVQLSGKGLNPGVVFPSWPGDLRIRLDARGRVADGNPEVRLSTFKADGRLRGQPFSLDAQGAYAHNAATVSRFDLSSGKTRLHADGTIGGTRGNTAHIAWTLNSDDIGDLFPDARGRISGKGSLSGPLRRPRCRIDLNARKAAYDVYRLTSLDLSADVDLSGKESSSITMDLREAHAGAMAIDQFHLQGHGDAREHAFMLDAETRQGAADLQIRGKLHHPWQADMAWRFQTVQATVSYPKLDAWSLQAPFAGEISGARLQFSQSCWQSGQARLCLSGQHSAEKDRADFDISGLPFSYFKAYLPERLDLAGSIGGTGHYERIAAAKPSANVLLNTTRTELRLHGDMNKPPQAERPVIAFLPGRLRFDLQQDRLEADMALPVSDTDGIDFKAAISPGRKPLLDRPLTGQVRTRFQNLDFIDAWLPGVEDFSGRLTGDLAFSGSLRRPQLNGRLELADGSARLERPGLDLKKIGITLTGEKNGAIGLTGHATSGPGDIRLDGSADFRGNAPKADIRVKGQNVTVFDTSEAQVDASPDLTIGLQDDRLDVTGEVVIPTAKIQLKKLPESAVAVSGDQTIIVSEGRTADQGAVEKSRLKINARVRITMGDNVTFDGFGLSAKIQGGLLAIEKPGEPTTGSGELRIVDGTYEAFGQKLDVEKGRVLFAGGPIDRPGIDARAVRRPAEGILVGVNVRGELRQPDVTLFSDPAMTQGNQLSYLVLGRPLSGASQGEGSALSRAVLALGLKGGNALAQKIGGKLGLDQLTVESSGNGSSSDASQASLVVGKYLTPKLYINYGIGLFDPVSTLRLQYAISSRWKLVTESSGTASGGDFIYTIETGR
jgi:translocation and assembly module TamB